MDYNQYQPGNYIEWKSGIYRRIKEVTGENIILETQLIDALSVRPILLNEHWAAKLGFNIIYRDALEKRYQRPNFPSLVLSEKLSFKAYVDPGKNEILKYVHSLQNFYLDLTGERL